MLDPFLVFDAYRQAAPTPAGGIGAGSDEEGLRFPAHAHRGFTELRYVLSGAIRHRDSCGNEGVTRPGGVQLFFAGRGAAHEENITTARRLVADAADGGATIPRTPPRDPLTNAPQHRAAWATVDPKFAFEGFQVWVNTPAALKDAPPRHRVVQHASFPVYRPADTKPFNAPPSYTPPPYAVVKVVAGVFGGLEGPLTGDVPGLLFLDVVKLQPRAVESLTVAVADENQHVIVYAYRGSVQVESPSDPDATQTLDEGEMAPLTPGLNVRLHAGEDAGGDVREASCLVLTAPRSGEPVFVGSGFAMATREALDAARRDLEEGRAGDCAGGGGNNAA